MLKIYLKNVFSLQLRIIDMEGKENRLLHCKPKLKNKGEEWKMKKKNLPSFSYKRMAPEGFTGTHHHLALVLLAALLFGACLCSAWKGTMGAEVILH